MKVLLDTNILLDFVLKRDPFEKDAVKIIELCRDGIIRGYIAAHSYVNMFYILRKHFTVEERKSILYNLSKITKIIQIDGKIIKAALNNDAFLDYEDCVQSECADSVLADYIITRNVKDYSGSKIVALSPDKFLSFYS